LELFYSGGEAAAVKSDLPKTDLLFFEVKNPFCILKCRKGFVMAKTKGHAIIFTEITFCLPH
jgi:hypothetical protein